MNGGNRSQSLQELQVPQSIKTEESILGSMIRNQEVIPDVFEILDPSEKNLFYKPAHQQIFNAMVSLFDRNEIIDPVTLVTELERKNQLETVGGPFAIASLMDSVVSTAHAIQHSKIVLEMALRRKLIDAANTIIRIAYDKEIPGDEFLDTAEQVIFTLSENRIKAGFQHIKEILIPEFKKIEDMHLQKKHITGISTGFKILDEMSSGLQPSDLIIVAGRPSMGKTSFCLNIAQHAAIERGIPVAVFSLEMSRESITQRFLSSEARIDASKIRTGYLTAEDWQNLTIAAGYLNNAPIYIDDTPGLSSMVMRAKARRLKSHHHIGLIIVDYLQLMMQQTRFENRQQEISYISRSLKALARELKIPLIALSQMSRDIEKRGGERKPQLSDLRESGSIEQDADMVLFIERPEMYDPAPEHKGKADVYLSKQRNGPTGEFQLTFTKSYTRFEDIAQEPVYRPVVDGPVF